MPPLRTSRRAALAVALLPLLLSIAACAHQEKANTSALPAVRLVQDVAGKPAPARYLKDYAFTDDWFSQDVPLWEIVTRPYRGKPNLQYLEVGLYEGRSALWALENLLTDPGSHLTGIDPFLGDYRDRWQANVEKSGQRERITTLVGYSQVELRNLPLDSFDIIYIDGSHSADDVLEDAVLSYRLLKTGGLLIFDDYLWHQPVLADTPRPAVDAFYTIFARHLSVLHNGYQVAFRKR